MSMLEPSLPDPDQLRVAAVGPATFASPLIATAACSSWTTLTAYSVPPTPATWSPSSSRAACPRRSRKQGRGGLARVRPRRRHRVAIVTCGGLCPGLNDVIRSLTLTLRTRLRRSPSARLPLRLRRAGRSRGVSTTRADRGRRLGCPYPRRDHPRLVAGTARRPRPWSTPSCATACRCCSASAATGRCGAPTPSPPRCSAGGYLSPWSASPRRSTTTWTGSNAASVSPPPSRRRRGPSARRTPKRAAR